jgi:DNA helicase-2/ATP-dependent DNA helicase PcrA
MPIELCDDRRRLLATDGHILVRGGAGSGKTTISLAKAAAEIESGAIGMQAKVLFLSFARATVARVAETAIATLPKSHTKRIEISTYHGFAWSILRSHAYLLCETPGVSLLLPAQVRGLLAGLSGGARSARLHELFIREGRISFDLFAPLATQILGLVPALARAYALAYPLIIVDEFQDTNLEEWRFIEQLGRHSCLIALGDPKQRIYDFKGADPRRFDDLIAAFGPTQFHFQGENKRSAGTQIVDFAEDLIDGAFRADSYTGITVSRYRGRSLRPLKEAVLSSVQRLRRRGGEWSLAVLVPTNALATMVFDYMGQSEHGLPRYRVDILVSAEGPMLAAQLVALLLEPRTHADRLDALILEALADFELGRTEAASRTAINNTTRYRELAAEVRAGGDAALARLVIGRAVQSLLERLDATVLTGDPMHDWRAIRRLFDESERAELQAVGKDARHLRLLQRGAQIESRFADAWRATGSYHAARDLLAEAVVEDQFTAITRPHLGVTVMTIHKAKGKEFDEVIVFENEFHRFLSRDGAEAVRSARFNLHVAVTRARTAARMMTPISRPCPLLD